jgi:hypothetical protein
MNIGMALFTKTGLVAIVFSTAAPRMDATQNRPRKRVLRFILEAAKLI